MGETGGSQTLFELRDLWAQSKAGLALTEAIRGYREAEALPRSGLAQVPGQVGGGGGTLGMDENRSGSQLCGALKLYSLRGSQLGTRPWMGALCRPGALKLKLH